MSYSKYDVDVSQSMYADYERLRKDYAGKRLKKESVLTILDLCGLPRESPKVFVLALKYEIILKQGYGRGAYYMVPRDMVPYSSFEKLEKDFYNGRPAREARQEHVSTEKETGRVVLDEDYCVRYLKERGYMCFKLTPDLVKLQKAFTPQFLLENCNAELK